MTKAVSGKDGELAVAPAAKALANLSNSLFTSASSKVAEETYVIKIGGGGEQML